MNKPTKTEFEEKYNVSISDKSFEILKTFLCGSCCDKNRTEFDEALKNCDVQALVSWCENTFQGR